MQKRADFFLLSTKFFSSLKEIKYFLTLKKSIFINSLEGRGSYSLVEGDRISMSSSTSLYLLANYRFSLTQANAHKKRLLRKRKSFFRSRTRVRRTQNFKVKLSDLARRPRRKKVTGVTTFASPEKNKVNYVFDLSSFQFLVVA